MKRFFIAFLLLCGPLARPSFCEVNESVRIVAQIRAASVTIESIADGKTVGMGSGTLMANKDGSVYCLTCEHVVQGGKKFKVWQHQGNSSRWIWGDVARSCKKRDVAIMELGKDVWGVSKLVAFLDALEPGENIIHCGSYHGQHHHSVARGMIACEIRQWDGLGYGQADFTVFPGSSGGGIFNEKGEYVGMCQSGLTNRVCWFVPAQDVFDFAAGKKFDEVREQLQCPQGGCCPDCNKVTKPGDEGGCKCCPGCKCPKECNCTPERKCCPLCKCGKKKKMAFTPDDPLAGQWRAMAEALIVTPGISPDDFPNDLPPEVCAAIERFCGDQEIWWTEDKAKWQWASYTASNIGWARSNYLAAKNLPKLCECERLPDAKIAADFYREAESWRSHLEYQAPLWPAWRIDLVEGSVAEAAHAARFWELARNALDTNTTPIYRRQYLAEARDMIGLGNWVVGNWPNPIPLHHIPRGR